MTSILGISAFYHDSAAALLIDGEIVCAAQEERFTRRKHDAAFPAYAVDWCLRAAGLSPGQLDFVGFYEKPLQKFERLLETYLAFAPRGLPSFLAAMPGWLRHKLHLPRVLARELGGAYRKRCIFVEHHLSHAASAFLPSPFEEAAILTLDSVGEWATGAWGVGRGGSVEISHQLRFPHSLGLLYSAFTYFTGFTVNSGEYKLMGLAPYGEPRYAGLIREHLIDLKEDGSLRLDLSYFNYCQGLTMTSPKLDRLLGGPPRRPDGPLTQREMDLAASVQAVVEEAVLRAARHVQAATGLRHLCLAGGVALNCVANGRLLREGPFDEIWVQPAAGDAGGALGVAEVIWHGLLGQPRTARSGDAQRGSLLGPCFADAEIRAFIRSTGAVHEELAGEAALCERVAELLAAGLTVGWFQGRMEFGPRALGARSILADPRLPHVQRQINRQIKLREDFRPFAPAVLAEHAGEVFDWPGRRESPYMLFVAPLRAEQRLPLTPADRERRGLDQLHVARSRVPGVTHVDFSARLQTVDAERHGRFRRLLEAFHARTGCPLLVNTSFNLGWEPIVATPADAYRTFMSSEMDALAIGCMLLEKRRQPAWVAEWRAESPGPEQEEASAAELRAGSAGGGSVLKAATVRRETAAGAAAARAVAGFADLLASPCCRAPLAAAGHLRCTACGRRFADDEGIARLVANGEGAGNRDTAAMAATATAAMTAAGAMTAMDEGDRRGRGCDAAPVPGPPEPAPPEAEAGEALRSFAEQARKTVLAAALDAAIPFNTAVLDVGCGSGRLVNFLAIGTRRVVGADLSLAPLRRAERFRHVNGLARALFVQMDLFRPCLRDESFDAVLCSGVLQQTADPAGGLARLAALVRPGGHLVVGLYHPLAPLAPLARLVRPGRRGRIGDAADRRAWLGDRLHPPHGSTPTMAEVRRWFDLNGLMLVRSIASLARSGDDLGQGQLFVAQPASQRLGRAAARLREILPGRGGEDGLFLMIARKPGAAGRAQN
jgi:carbamoyltransferase